MPSNSVFSFEEYLKLADHVSRHPCLFDKNHPAFNDQTVKENLWTKISNVFEISLTECKMHWSDMTKFYKKMTTASSNSKSATNIKNSKSKIMDALCFLNVDVCKVPPLDLCTNVVTSSTSNSSEPTIMTTSNKCDISVAKNKQLDDAMQELMELDDNHLFEVLFETVRQFCPNLKEITKQRLLQVYTESTEIFNQFWTEMKTSSLTAEDREHLVQNYIRRSKERNYNIMKLIEIEDDTIFITIFNYIKKLNPDLKTRTKLNALRVIREMLDMQTKFINIDE